MTDDPAKIASGNPIAMGARDAVKVRSAIPADVPTILAIEQQSPGASHWSVNEYERILEREVLLVAEVGTQVVGFICGKQGASEWELDNIAVAPTFRRSRIGEQLLSALIAHVRQCSGSNIFLEVRDSNLPARRFYEKYRFVDVGRRRRYYHHPEEDAVLYKLEVRL